MIFCTHRQGDKGPLSYLIAPYHHYSTIPIKDEAGRKSLSKKRASDTYFTLSDIDRNNPLLVQIVEEMGEQANGMYAKLKVVEVPDGVEWQIEEYDGLEHVAAIHEIWG